MFLNKKVMDIDYASLLEMEEETIQDVIPSLEQVLDLLKREMKPQQKFIINIEIKSSDPSIIDCVLGMVQQRSLEEYVYFSSFHWFHKKNLLA